MATKRRVGSGASGGKARARGPRARGLFVLALIGFVVVASLVILRRVVGVKQQTQIRQLEQTREALEAERIRLEGEIREASSRQRLESIAEKRLNMHIARPQEIVNFALPPAAKTPHPPHDSL